MADWILKGRYLMGDVIGSGGMAMVYKASRLDTGETVAIKMLRPEYMEDASYVRQFRKEAQICIEPVSYTHLDVYKRQAQGRAVAGGVRSGN